MANTRMWPALQLQTPVPLKNGVLNNYTSNVVGNKTDDDYPTSSSLAAFAKEQYGIQHLVSKLYPTKAAPLTISTSGVAWGDPVVYTTLIPAAFTTLRNRIVGAVITSINATGDFELHLFYGAGHTAYGKIAFSCNVIGTDKEFIPILGPVLAIGVEVSARLYSGNASIDSANVKLVYQEL